MQIEDHVAPCDEEKICGFSSTLHTCRTSSNHWVTWTVTAGEVLPNFPFHWGFLAASNDLLGSSCPQQLHLPLHEFFSILTSLLICFIGAIIMPLHNFTHKYISLFLYIHSIFPVTTTDPGPWRVICKSISNISSKEPSSKLANHCWFSSS